MASTYTPYYSSYARSRLNTHRPTWSETQAAVILSFRDISNPSAKKPDPDIQALDAGKQIHARWTDPDLVSTLSRLRESVSPKVELSIKYGGRDVTAATWITVHQTLPGGTPELTYVLWFHEYDELDVEVGQLADVKWGMQQKAVKQEISNRRVMEEDVDELERVKKEGPYESCLRETVQSEDVDMDG